ncbi:MAG TPA: histidine kinase [Chitinophagaceae bacterium]|nr:histidine kinase [Chitinophagaceae bacterium]
MNKKVLIQIAIWIAFFFFWYQIVYVYVDNIGNRLLFTFLDVFLIIVLFYFVYSFAVPRLLLKKRRVSFAITLIAVIALSSIALIWVMKAILQLDIFRIEFRMSWNLTSLYNNRFAIALFGAIAGFVSKLSMEWMQAKKRIREVELEKTKAELEYLKNQVNPHFLFNVLNTIYFQLDESTDAARNSLLKFSDILRYQLYDCNDDYVPVINEINYLNNYIKIQKLRKEKNYIIDFVFDKNWSTEKIAPLLLIPFVENAFKYVSDSHTHENIIKISALKKGKSFHFSCINTFDETNLKDTGLGITNTKRRLELIYPGRHNLLINTSHLFFTVQLTIEL